MTYKLNEIFTPAASASLTYVERSYLNKELKRGIDIDGMQIVIYGQTGSGKTTFLKNKLEDYKRDFISISCTEQTTVQQLIYNTFDRLNR